MPQRALTTCPSPGCRSLTRGGRCPQHAAQAQRDDVAYRGSAASRGYGAAWAKARAAHVASHPFCEQCLREGKRTPVAIVHHRIEPRGDPRLLVEPSNLVSSCRPHHQQEHARRARPGFVAPRSS